MKVEIIGLFVAAAIATTSSFAHSKAIKPEFVDMLLKPYFELQASLSKDDLKASQKNASAFKTMLGHGPSHESAPSLEDLGTEADKITNASDLATARNAFHAISKDLGKMVEHVGTTGKQDVFKMSCPMAFGNKGGEWLQNHDDTANPYFGSMMFGCGSVQTHLAKAEGDHSGHDSEAKEKMAKKKGHGKHDH